MATPTDPGSLLRRGWLSSLAHLRGALLLPRHHAGLAQFVRAGFDGLDCSVEPVKRVSIVSIYRDIV